MAYQIEFSPASRRQFKKLPRSVQSTLAERIDTLAQEPLPKDAKKLSVSARDLWRVREGDYRIVYEVREAVLVVLVVKVGHRRPGETTGDEIVRRSSSERLPQADHVFCGES